jgi:hypothetical protein
MSIHLRACVIRPLFSVAIFIVLGLQAVSMAQPRSYNLDGVYELVSQNVRLTKPVKETYSLNPPRWKGLWIIRAGHFSSILSKSQRNELRLRGSDEGKAEFESFAGTYKVNGEDIIFTQQFSWNPLFEGRPVIMSWRRKGRDILVLTQRLHPHVEDSSEGSITIVLRRIG